MPQQDGQSVVSRRGVAMGLLGIFAVATALRLAQLGGPSLWMDEIWSIEISSGRGSAHAHLPEGIIQNQQVELTALKDAPSWWCIWPTIADQCSHPPLYHIILRWWMDVLGNGAAATRGLSVLFSLAAVLIVFDIARLLHDRRTALLMAGMMAVAIGQIQFAQETRSYAMLTALCLAAAEILVRIEKFGVSRRRLLGLFIFSAAAALTHYLAAGALLAILLYAVLALRGQARRAAVGTLVAAAVLVIVAWGPFFVRQMRSSPQVRPVFLMEPPAHHVPNTLRRIVGMPTQYLLGGQVARELPSPAIITIAFVALVLPWIFLRWRRDLLLWCLWTTLVIGLVAGIDLVAGTTQMVYLRYTVLATPGVCAAVVSLNWRRLRGLRYIVPILAIVAVGMLAGKRALEPIPAKEDWREFSAYLQASAATDELLIFYGGNPWVAPGTWYMGFRYYQPAANHPWLILSRQRSLERVRAELAGRASVWLIGFNPAHDGPRLLPGWHVDSAFTNTAGAFCQLVHDSLPAGAK